MSRRKRDVPNGSFRRRMFDKLNGPWLESSGYCVAMDTPYGLCTLYDEPFSMRIMDGECSMEFIEEIAKSNLPDANVSNLILNMKNYKEAREGWDLPRERRLKYVMEGLIGIYNGIDVPVTAGNAGFWWWGLDGNFRKAEGIPDSAVEKWKAELPARMEKARKAQEEWDKKHAQEEKELQERLKKAREK